MEATFYIPSDTNKKSYTFNTSTNYDATIINKDTSMYQGTSPRSLVNGKSFDISIDNIRSKYTNKDSNSILSLQISNSISNAPSLNIMVRNSSFDNGIWQQDIKVIGGDIAVVTAKGYTFVGYVSAISYNMIKSTATITISGFISKLYEVSYAGKAAANSLLFPDYASTVISRRISTLVTQMSQASYLGRVPIVSDILNLESLSLFTVNETQGSILKKIADTFSRNYYQKMNGLVIITQATDLDNSNLSNTYKLDDLIVQDIDMQEDFSAIPHTITATMSNMAQLSTTTKQYQVTFNDSKTQPIEFQLDLADVWTTPSVTNLTQLQYLISATINSPILTFDSSITNQELDKVEDTSVIDNLSKQWLYNAMFEHLRTYLTYNIDIINPPVIDAGDYIQLPNGDVTLITDVSVNLDENSARVSVVPIKYWQYNLQFNVTNR